MPGVPSVYYGSEWGIKGQKNNTDHDYPLRPCVEISDIEDNDLYRHVCRLGAVRRKYKALKYGSFEITVIRNEQLVFKRKFEDETVYIAVNLSGNDFDLGFNTDGGVKLYDVFDGKTVFDVNGCYANINIPAHGTRVLVLTGGEAPEYPDNGKEETADDNVIDNDDNEIKPLPEIGAKGLYRHFKGGIYEFICIAKDTETSEEFVIYKEAGTEGRVWSRPVSIFYQYVDVDGKQTPRFELINN